MNLVMATEPVRPVKVISGLTGLRGIGAAWVVLFHLQQGSEIPVLDVGYMGVDLFFILSGFVL
jgi:peptidoglycan/LPS O-acetylase OafA/YrhL